MVVLKRRSHVTDHVIIALTAALMATNYYVFILPNQFAPAGLSGINTMVQYLFNFSVGYLSLIRHRYRALRIPHR